MKEKKLIRIYFCIISLTIFCVTLGSLFWNIVHERKSAKAFATLEAQTIYKKDVSYRRWAALHGGVYVPITEKTPPNPHLSHVPNRDITTQSGKKLTLINPAYMTRQVFEISKKEYGIRGHITSQNPVNEKNKPDLWELNAFKKFSKDKSFHTSIEKIGKDRYLRFMTPMVVEKKCLKCHLQHGYKVGEIGGGISVSVSMEKYDKVANSKIKKLLFSHLLILLIFSVSTGLIFINYQTAINDRNDAESAIKENEKRLKNAQKLSKVGNWELNLTTNHLEWSDEIYRIYEISKETFEPSFEKFLEAIHPDDREMVNNAYNTSIKNKSKYSIDHRLIVKSGKVKYVHEQCDTIFDNNSKPIKSVGTITDITERKLMEIALKESEKKYRNIIESTREGFLLTNISGKIMNVNQSFCNMSGLAQEDLLSMNIADLPITKLTDSKPIDLKEIAQKHYKNFESQYTRGDNSTFFIEVSITFNTNEENGNFIIFIKDITARKTEDNLRKKLERQLQQSQKLEAIGTLTGGIAHDFNNLLTPIMGYADMMKYKMSADDQYFDFAAEILNSSMKAKELIKQLLTFSRKNKAEVGPLNLIPVIKSSVKLIRSSLPASIHINTDLPPQIDNIMANNTQIHQIIMNLCINSSHAMIKNDGMPKGQINIKVKQIFIDEISKKQFVNLNIGTHIQIIISDNGKGMSQEVLSHIFEPFYTTKKEGHGTGMGLAVVHGIVKSYGGEVKVYSQINKGTTFNIYFPITKNKEKQNHHIEKVYLENRKEKIFILDDREYITNLLASILSPCGFNIECSNDSVVALKYLIDKHQNFDLVITDLTMPEITGIDLIKKLRSDAINIPAIILTGHGDTVHEDELKLVDAVLLKPILVDELFSVLNRIFTIH